MIQVESVSLSVRLVPSTIPELGGLYAVCNFHLMFKVLLTCYTKSATKAGPLSNPMLVGNPNLGTISLIRHQATFDALSVWVGKGECTYYDQQVMVVSVRFHFSEVRFQVFKGQRAFYLNPCTSSLSLFTFMHWRRKWQPTPVFLLGESQGWGSLLGCRLWGCTESDTIEVT